MILLAASFGITLASLTVVDGDDGQVDAEES
jgi:hypothetical protein